MLVVKLGPFDYLHLLPADHKLRRLPLGEICAQESVTGQCWDEIKYWSELGRFSYNRLSNDMLEIYMFRVRRIKKIGRYEKEILIALNAVTDSMSTDYLYELLRDRNVNLWRPIYRFYLILLHLDAWVQISNDIKMPAVCMVRLTQDGRRLVQTF